MVVVCVLGPLLLSPTTTCSSSNGGCLCAWTPTSLPDYYMFIFQWWLFVCLDPYFSPRLLHVHLPMVVVCVPGPLLLSPTTPCSTSNVGCLCAWTPTSLPDYSMFTFQFPLWNHTTVVRMPIFAKLMS